MRYDLQLNHIVFTNKNENWNDELYNETLLVIELARYFDPIICMFPTKWNLDAKTQWVVRGVVTNQLNQLTIIMTSAENEGLLSKQDKSNVWFVSRYKWRWWTKIIFYQMQSKIATYRIIFNLWCDQINYVAISHCLCPQFHSNSTNKLWKMC